MGQQLEERLDEMRDVVREKEKKAKEKMKRFYDRKAKVREFEVGSLVMIRIPGMSGKLEDAWDGPYEVNMKCGDVNYEVII